MKLDCIHVTVVRTQPPLTYERFQNVSSKVWNSPARTMVPKERYEKINNYILAIVVEVHCGH